jgi:hypothetical protein
MYLQNPCGVSVGFQIRTILILICLMSKLNKEIGPFSGCPGKGGDFHYSVLGGMRHNPAPVRRAFPPPAIPHAKS